MRVLLLFLALAACGQTAVSGGTASDPAKPPPTGSGDVLETSAGRVEFHPVHHGTVRVSIGDRTVWIDPWSKAKLDGPKADLVLVTDIHQDHFDAAGIEAVRGPNTKVIAPAVVAEKFPEAVVLANGESKDLGFVKVEAIP